jgi:hypothetical protein
VEKTAINGWKKEEDDDFTETHTNMCIYIYICACDMYIMSQLASLDDRSVSTSSFGSGVFNKTLSGCVSTPNPEID